MAITAIIAYMDNYSYSGLCYAFEATLFAMTLSRPCFPTAFLDEIEGYVERVILTQYKIREATNYAPPLRLLSSK